MIKPIRQTLKKNIGHIYDGILSATPLSISNAAENEIFRALYTDIYESVGIPVYSSKELQ